MFADHLNEEALYWASFNRFEFRLTGLCVQACYHQGDCDADVSAWVSAVRDQIAADNFPRKPTPDAIREELREYGNWNEEELSDDEANFKRILWLAAGNIAEEDEPDCSAPVPPATV